MEENSGKIAIVLGMDSYLDPLLEALPSCRKDALDVSSLLSRVGYKIFNDGPILGSDYLNDYGWVFIQKLIRDFFSNAEPGETLLFYFSGHGIPKDGEIYLSTPQVNPKNPLLEGLGLGNLARIVNSSKATEIISVIDGCYSGAASLGYGILPPEVNFKRKAAAQSSAEIASSQYETIIGTTPPEGRCYLLSSQAYEPALAIDGDNSVYTKYFLKGLKGAVESRGRRGIKIPGSVDIDGCVTPVSLHQYLVFNVSRIADQKPKLKADFTNPIVLVQYPELARSSTSMDPATQFEVDENLGNLSSENNRTPLGFLDRYEVDKKRISEIVPPPVRNRTEVEFKHGNQEYSKFNLSEFKVDKFTMDKSGSGPELLWKTKIALDGFGFGHRSAISSDGEVIYVGTGNSVLYAIDSRRGGIYWSVKCSGRIDTTPAISSDGTILYVATTSDIYAISTENSGIIWKCGIGSHSYSCPVLSRDNHVLYVGSDHSIYAIDTFNGKRIWKSKTGDKIRSTQLLSIDNESIFFASEDKNIYAANTRNGKRLWKFKTKKYIQSSPAISSDGNYLFIGGLDNHFYCLETSGKLRWIYEPIYLVLSTPIVSFDGSLVCFGSADNNLYAVDTMTGNLVWSFQAKDRIDSTPALSASGSVIYAGSADNNLYAVDSKTGMLIWKYALKGAVYSPAISPSGIIYFGCGDGNLYALNPS